ncbi:MAG: DUF6518 family protein [Eubacteriales bacterium]|nr:DUF6518 family protein [Eubacteriales bacterium]
MKKISIAIATGIIVGILTLIGQKYLPINLNFLANSGAIWLIPAFSLSYFFHSNLRNSIATSITCLVGCVCGYYIFEAIYNQHSFAFNRWAFLWLVMALLAGTVFGAGAYIANTKKNWLQYCSMNLLPAVFVAEGMDHLLHIEAYLHMVPAVISKIIIGIILYVIINKNHCVKPKNLISFVLITIIGILSFAVLYGNAFV